MMNEPGLRRVLPGQSSGSGHTFGTPRHPSVIDPILSKRVCFYKSGDPQFNGLRMVINNRTFKTFDALLDSLSKKVPLPFGVRNITTPRGVHAVSNLDDLEDGKSYICSDSRKVKPFNLARARRKLPPWYHARPATSSRRRTVQRARMFPGRNKREPTTVHTPRRLLVFRNGDPTVRHVVVLSKRTTPTFENMLEYISEMIQFHVVKLLTSDGKRVDGLPGLILCSGTVVAAGREPFKPGNYSTQQSPPLTVLPTNRKSVRRLKALNRKKKSPSNTSKSRPFSPLSERFIVNQIHNSITGSSSELRSNHSNSVEWESGHVLESVAETEGETGFDEGVEGQGCLLPTDDDIEKSFRVNQDGSMTVEMKVRLTLKEEETVHWTTTLTRSAVANLLNETSLPPPEEEQISSQNSLDSPSPSASIDTINKDKTKDDNDEDPPTSCNGAPSENSIEEDDIKVQTALVSPKRAPTPGHRQFRTKQASIESVKSVTAEGIQEGVVGSYSYIEQTEHGAVTEQYCLVKQCSTRPVPKPRRLGSVETNCVSSRNVAMFKSAGMAESSGEEVTETVLHIYEQQNCPDNYLANLCAHGTNASVVAFRRPATSETGLFSSNNDSEPELWRPSTASESMNLWRAGSDSLTSDVTLPLPKTGVVTEANSLRRLPKPDKGKSKGKSLQTDSKIGKLVSTKPKLMKKRVHRLMSPKKKQKANSSEATEKRKKVKTFSSAGFLKKIYGNKSKSKSAMKIKKGPAQTRDRGITSCSSQQSDDTIKDIIKDPNTPSTLNEIKMETEKSRLNVAPEEISQPRGILARQTSMHQEKRNENESYDISKSISLPAFNSSSAFTNEYVEDWLEKAHFEPKTQPDEESIKAEKVIIVQKETSISMESEKKNSSVIEVKEFKYLENTSQTGTCKTLQIEPLPENVLGSSVKQRIQSLENKASPLLERTSVHQQTVHQTFRHTEYNNTLAQNDTTPPTNETSTDIPPDSPVKISFQNATPSALSMDFPPPPSPPAENSDLSNTEYCEMDVSSPASSPFYRLSSVSSQTSDRHPLSISPSSEKVASPTELTMEKAPSVQTSFPPAIGEAPLQRGPSVKRAPLVSNLSFGRTMALRKACMEKYALCSDAASETTSPAPINVMDDNVVQNDDYSTSTQLQSETPPEETQLSTSMLDSKSSPFCCTSASPTSLTSEERVQPPSISSGDHLTPSDLQSKETETSKTPLSSQTDVPSPKPLVKKVQLSSPSPERKPQTKKLSPERSNKPPKLSSVRNHPPDKTMSPNTGRRREASPSTEKKQTIPHQKPKLQKTLSPYSQSLDVVSPPVRHRSSKKLLSRNHSSDDTSESSHGAQRKTPSVKQSPQTPTGELDKSLSCNTSIPVEVNQRDESEVNKTDNFTTSGQETSNAETQKMPQPLNTSNQPDITSVLEDICYSIKSIRLITQNKRPSCLERSNSLPDFSSHVASTFGSSSKALLAFLAVMTLKEGLTNLNVNELNANNVSCAEALKMIDSLKEIASIEDSHKLKDSLSELQQSASKQLLESWKGFQELEDRCKSRSSTPQESEHELVTDACPEKDCTDENVIDEIMDNLDMPEKLKEELASLSMGFQTDNDNAEICARIKEEVEPSLNIINAKQSHSLIEDAVPVKDASQDENANVNVSSIIKKFTVIETTSRIEETAKHNRPNQPTKAAIYLQSTEANSQQPEPEVGQLHSTELHVKENIEATELCGQGEEDNGRDKSSEDEAADVVSSNKNIEQDSCTSEVEEQDKDDNRVQMQSEESTSVPANEPTCDDESGLEQEGQYFMSGRKDLLSCDGGSSGSDADEGHVSDEGAEVECEGKQQESRESDNLSNPVSPSEEEEEDEVECEGKQQESRESVNLSNPGCPSEEEEHKQQSSSYCVETSNKDALSNSDSETKQHSDAGYIGVGVSVDESMCNSDEDEAYSEDEQHEAEHKDVKVASEGSLSNDEEEQESMLEEEYTDDLVDEREQTEAGNYLEDLVEETEDKTSLEDEDCLVDKRQVCDETRSLNTVRDDLGNVIESQGSYNKSDSLVKGSTFSADEDSGNDHSSCEEHLEICQPMIEDEHINSSNEEELSYIGKGSDLEEEDAITDVHIEETFSFATQSEDKKCDKPVEKPKHQSVEVISQTVAERVILLEKQVADEQKKNTSESSPKRCFSQRNVPLELDVDDSPKSQSAPGSRSAPQSSLSFSYDSSGVITTEPEGFRVRSIREMFLAKSATDIQQGHKPFPSPNPTEMNELRAQTSTSAGYESQTSSEPSSGEDDSPRKSISKGFVRRTIERLYGMRNATYDEEACERPPSVQKETKKEDSSFFSPFHGNRSKAMPELSYFNSTSALDNFTEATRCLAFNAKVMPGHGVPVNSEQMLFSENTQIRKSVSDPVGINKTFTKSTRGEGLSKDTEENASYSLPGTKAELEDKVQSFTRKCTYFSLPHASDSDACQDDLSIVSKGSLNGDSIIDLKDISEDTKMPAERNGTLPGVGVTDFKKMDNKVHPLVESPTDGNVVVVQPGKGQGVMNRRLQDPDMLDLLYDFCGQNCPIL